MSMTSEMLSDNKNLKELVTGTGPCVTIVLAGNEAGDTTVEFKDALGKVRHELEARGIDAAAFLEPVLAPDAVPAGETKRRGPIAILLSPETLLVRRVGPAVQPVVSVSDRFELRTLLSIADKRTSFYILALSQNRTRMLECTDDNSQEIPLPAGFPQSLVEAMQSRKPDHVLDNRAAGGPSTGSMKGVMFGTSTEREDKDEYMLHFFMELDKGVNVVLKSHTEPLVIVGVEHELALYMRVNTYPHLVPPGVHGAPDGLDGGDMHRRALDLLAAQTPEPARTALTDFDKKVGTGHASTHIQEIVAAAYEGRASHIFFQENAKYEGIFDTVRGRVKHSDDPLDSPVNLIEEAAIQAILHGGEAHILPSSAMPNGVPVCAIFRYPSAQQSGMPYVGVA